MRAAEFVNGLGVAAQNSLGRANAVEPADLAQLTALQVLRLPNLGAKTFSEIIDCVICAWARQRLIAVPAQLTAETDGTSPLPG